MELSTYIQQIFSQTEADVIQFEVRLDSRGKVAEGGSNVVRFNMKRIEISTMIKSSTDRIKRDIETTVGTDRRRKRS